MPWICGRRLTIWLSSNHTRSIGSTAQDTNVFDINGIGLRAGTGLSTRRKCTREFADSESAEIQTKTEKQTKIMGSFNATCIISNLPIEAGTPVRFVNLVRSTFHPDGNDHRCYVTGRWHLRGPAIRAQYNDYGSIEKIQDGLAARVMFESLAQEAVEKGVGDNQFHDVEVRPGMDRKAWLKALWEGRVYVQDGRPRRKHPDGTYKSPEPEEGIPSLARMEALIQNFGSTLSKDHGDPGFMADEVSRGFIRIRNGRTTAQTPDQELESLADFVRKAGYAAMVTCGTGSYADNAEILVAPLPARDNKHIFADGMTENEFLKKQIASRPVTQAMIREDVWQFLLNTELDSWNGKYTIAKVLEDSKSTIKQKRELKALQESGDMKYYHLAMESEDDHKNAFSSMIRGGEGVSGFSLKQSFELAMEIARNKKELDVFIQDLVETAFVQCAYSWIHGQWHPTTNSGQDGNWKMHREFMMKLLTVKGKYEDEESEDEEESENSEDEESFMDEEESEEESEDGLEEEAES